MKKYILLVIAIVFFIHINAQEIINVCGNDTIILEVENYDNGLIEWEESTDTITWVTIPEQVGEQYKFWPTETKYYRASVKTSTCEPLISVVTLVQMPPKANAGTDRIIGGNSTTLLGNIDEGTEGNWSFSQGANGQLAAPANPYCDITGEYDQAYQVIWTLSNVCGQDKDTVNIEFEEIVAKNNFIVVDNTDELVEISDGSLKIKFSDSGIKLFDDAILIGMREDTSFFLKSKSFILKDGLYEIVTEQAKLEEVFESGTINIGDAVNQSMDDSKKNFGTFPTRETLKLKSKNKGLTVLYASDFYNEDGSLYQREKGFNVKNGLYLGVSNKTLFASTDDNIKLYTNETFISLKPNFVADISFHITKPIVRNIKVGLDNAGLEFGYDLVFTAKQAKELLNIEKTFISISKRIVAMVGPVPIVIIPSFKLIASANMNASAELIIEKSYNNKKTYTALIAGPDIKSLKFIKYLTNKITNTSSFDLDGNFDAEFKMGPEVSVTLYDIVGTYLYLPAKLNIDACIHNYNWQASLGLSYEGRLGVRAKIFSKELFDKYISWEKPLMPSIIMPDKIELKSGNYQTGFADEELENPISLKVVSSYGFGVPFVPVTFETEDGSGSVTDETLYSDIHGRVNNNWTLGSNETNILKATINGCDENSISTLFVDASTFSGNYDCSDGNLSITMQTEQDKTILVATGGIEPYAYSTDGYNFSAEVPEYPNNIDGNYSVYVRDGNQCIAYRNVIIDAGDICKNGSLELEIETTGDIFKLNGINGAEPYQYSVDNQSAYTGENI